mmetsp:Transcript_4751/g.19515  ORF Transcript_4751/g.19515 Transcript_4751/m.19515 type:complete len:346 (-) Transcript_4751:822-1859(-)
MLLVLLIPPPPPLMAMGSDDEESDPMNISASRLASALHASSNPSPLPAVCGDWSMVSNAAPDDPPPFTRSPARPLTAWLSAAVPKAPAGRDDPTGGPTGWNPTMGFPECVRPEESRAPPLLVRSWWTAPLWPVASAWVMLDAFAWVMLDSMELDLWESFKCGGIGLIGKPPPPSSEYPRAEDDRPTAFVGATGTGTSATGPLPCVHLSPSACRHRSRMQRISTSSTGADAGARLWRFAPPAFCSRILATKAARVHLPTVGLVGAAVIMQLAGSSSHLSRPRLPLSGSDDTSSACVAMNLSFPPMTFFPGTCGSATLSSSLGLLSIASNPPRASRSHALSPGMGPR